MTGNSSPEEPATFPDTRPERELAYQSRDGLALFARDLGDRNASHLPVICLPGLSRTSRDFVALAKRLTSDSSHPRRVVAFDYRGRGRSAWDPNPAHYNATVEMNDILDGLSAAGISRCVVVGTSRGGIIGMMLALARPEIVAGLVLNDVGPAIESMGLARIKSYVGRTPAPDDWTDAARIQRRLHGRQFTTWNDDDWNAFARLTYRENGGQPASDYDPALAHNLEEIELDRPPPTMWTEFESLKPLPLMVIRGENSDLLSVETVKRMRELHPTLASVSVEGEGHAPILRGPLADAIADFVRTIDESNKR